MVGKKPNIYLVGMPGAGKSTVGKALARKLDLPFFDADQEMNKQTGVTISTIFELEGEAGFRLRESQLIEEFCARDGIVLATGGGAILKEENRAALSSTGTVIYLHASLDHLWQRTRRDSRRPLLRTDNPRDTLKALLDVREGLYRETADVTIETGRQSVGKLLHDLEEELSRRDLWPLHGRDTPDVDAKRLSNSTASK
jgi:shikimate kinase